MQSDSKDSQSFSYGQVRGCPDDHYHFQVAVNEDPASPLHFQILQGHNSFTMFWQLLAADKPDPLGNGPELMKTH